MDIFLRVLLIIAIVIVALFVLTFLVYIFNLDMKMMTKLKPLFMKHYENRKKKERKI